MGDAVLLSIVLTCVLVLVSLGAEFIMLQFTFVTSSPTLLLSTFMLLFFCLCLEVMFCVRVCSK